MNETILSLLEGKAENHLMPFFWQHGEDEATLRDYMRAIEEANCGAVCVESRPHPDFCGEKWWQDMDVILDEARKRNMQVWILDDSHFPTGFANGAVDKFGPQMHRQSICANPISLDGEARPVELTLEGLIPPPFEPVGMMEQYILPSMLENAPKFDDDRVLAVTAVNKATGEAVSLPLPEAGQPLRWDKPEGDWTVWVVGLSRNCGPHRSYINMMDPESVRILIDAVYEPHWAHYSEDFGKTIAGFFSDEPELGNGHLYHFDNPLGTEQDLPFSKPLEQVLTEKLGPAWANQMYLLWENGCDRDETAALRFVYMDAVSALVRDCFSRQLGDWCRAHGVKYIGHMLEDGNVHARTGSGLGHYFRGLDGQDMAGVDDIGGQVLPQGEDEPTVGMLNARSGTFYHFYLANLAASGAAIQPEKHGDAMCEVFGAYGWSEGVRLEKYLADHFLVRGVNHFVPHAFSPAPFPDPDCPPHFYAHGNNPQYRHFGKIMAYMNRVATLTSGGKRIAPVGILYHGESEWAGEAMLDQIPARKLAEAQIEYTTIPSDVFAQWERYHTRLGETLIINDREYSALVIPKAQYVTAAFAQAAAELHQAGFPLYFIESLPAGVCDGENALLAPLADCVPVSIDELPALIAPEAKISPASSCIRAMHYQGKAEFWYFVNEAAQPWTGSISLPADGPCYWYDAWENAIYPEKLEDGSVSVTLEPLRGYLLILDKADKSLLRQPVVPAGKELPLRVWKRGTCAAIAYPDFGDIKEVQLPDDLAGEQPEFSGFARYDSGFVYGGKGRLLLEITDAFEGVEVFLNEQSAGIQIAPPFRYDLTGLAREGENFLAIEVATTLERWSYSQFKDDPRAMMMGMAQEPKSPTGITGEVKLYLSEK